MTMTADYEGAVSHCDVRGCDSPALAKVLPTHGKTDHHGFRCRDCLHYDLSRGWFEDWREAIERRNNAE